MLIKGDRRTVEYVGLFLIGEWNGKLVEICDKPYFSSIKLDKDWYGCKLVDNINDKRIMITREEWLVKQEEEWEI